MKKILGIIMLAGIAGQASAQDAESKASRWYFGLNAKYGKVSESTTFRNIGSAYLNTVEAVNPAVTVTPGQSFGADLQLGYFFGKRAQWGIATGIIHQQYNSELSLDGLRLQYQSTDFNGDVFRQVVTAERPFSESLRTSIVSIPLLLKYRTRLSEKLGLMIDAGAVYNVSAKVRSSADASFRYEAIYKYVPDGNAYKPVYDDALTPDPTDWLITVEQYEQTSDQGTVNDYFAQLRGQGYNVALGEEVRKRSAMRYKAGSVGFLLQPSLSFKLNAHTGLQLGGYCMYQQYGGTEATLSRRITDRAGSYNTHMNNAEHSTQISYGLNAGLSFSW